LHYRNLPDRQLRNQLSNELKVSDPCPKLVALLGSTGAFSNREALGQFVYDKFRSEMMNTFDESYPEWLLAGDEMQVVFRQIGEALYKKLLPDGLK